MNNNLLFALNVFFSGVLKNFLVTFRAINLNFTISIFILITIIIFPFLGIGFYNLTNKYCLKKSLKITNKLLLCFFSYIFLIMILIDLTCKLKKTDYICKNQHKLPLFFNCSSIINNDQKVFLSNNLKPLRDEKIILNELNKKNLQIQNKPNIFIFIVESLRKDFITKEIASNIFSFKNENITSDTSFSASNATQISWYSIFHSNYPIFWAEANKKLKLGSIPLNILKKAGYKINVFTSAEMSYFHMDKLIFGKDNLLVDNFNDLSLSSKIASERDKLVIEKLKEEINKNKNKNSNVFLIFLDSTHSEYSWPKNFNPKFFPFINKINYITLSQSKKNLELIINRYKNAIYYIDSLFNDFLSTLRNNNLYNDSIIVLTGDHGEEFFEENSLFHASHLSDYQIKVPIIFKLLKNNTKQIKAISHINIFPTILDEILPNENFNDYFDGRSIFSKNLTSYIICVNQKGYLTSNELLIIKEHRKLHGKLTNKKKTFFTVKDTKNIFTENIKKELEIALENIIE